MKQHFRFLQVLSLAAAIMALQACDPEAAIEEFLSDLPESSSSPLKSKTSQTFFGPTVPIGNGVARAWVMQEKDGTPSAVGVTLSEKVLERLPEHMAEFVLDLPRQAGSDFYTHATLDWNPAGHEPPGTYDLPHFDIHFYIISEEDRAAIGPDDQDAFANAPHPIYVPPAYLQTPGGIPGMGAHWIDLLAPEFNGGVFTRTFIWGSYDGEFIFWEPMCTLDYLLSQPDEEVDLRLPAAYQRDGWYPTKYRILYSTRPGEYTIALTGLTFRSGTPAPAAP
ncbi:MAG TPA: hypothetical protein ENO20_08775 [Bacteroides sp.]|mgnify:CR=1 FL=1|nr:hypothetical protein [Bacteroides sp.]